MCDLGDASFLLEDDGVKRVFACILIAIILLGVFASCGGEDKKNSLSKASDSNKDRTENDNTAEALLESSKGLTFELNADKEGYTVTGIGTCTAKDIVIGEYNDLPVTKIRYEAFRDCTAITGVTIGESVTSVESSAFYGCTALDAIVIPDSVTDIGAYAFSDCLALKSITLPNSIQNIGNGAFYRTSYYNNQSNWDDGVLYIGKYLIKAKDTVSDSYAVKTGTLAIASNAFFDLKELCSITIPDSVISIGNKAFDNCTTLETIDFKGAKSEWNAIKKGDIDNAYTGKYTVKCTDGNISEANDK